MSKVKSTNFSSSQEDFDSLYVEFWPKIHHYVTRLVGSQVAEDLTQEIFLKIRNSSATFRNESQLSTWVYRIATNAAIDKLRSSRNQTSARTAPSTIHKADADVDIDINNIAGSQKCLLPETQVIHNEMNSCIHAFIDDLPEMYHTVVILSEFEGLKNKEIAEVLGLSLGVVKIRLHRAKEKLKDAFSKNCNFYRDDRNVLACEPKGPLKNKK